MNKKNSSGPPDVAGKPPLAFFEFSAAVARLSRRFRVDVSPIVRAVALTQSLLLAKLGYRGSQRLVAKIGASAHAANHHRTEDNVLAVLAKTESAVGALAAAPSLGPAGEHAQRTAELLWTLLQQSPELDSLYVADDTGQMLMALRYPVPAIRRITRGAGAGELAIETWQYKLPPEVDAQQRFATQRIESFRGGYDPRLQRWYQQARQVQRPVWTAPYIFAATQELGVTYALTSKRRAAEGSPRLLVVGGDVSLGRLSQFVRLFASDGRGDSAVLGALHDQMLGDGTAGSAGGAAFSFDHDARPYLAQASPSGSPRRMTVMFTDIEGFTRISESMETNVLVRMLTEYFNLATGVLARYGGVIDKFMGDGIMVLWGAPADLKDAAYRACLAALQLHIEMGALNRKRRADGAARISHPHRHPYRRGDRGGAGLERPAVLHGPWATWSTWRAASRASTSSWARTR